jgi:hypothetical protein
VKRADNLESYIVCNQPRPDAPSDVGGAINREAAQRNDLTGVGTMLDYITPQTEPVYAKQLANLPGGQDNVLAEQRLLRIFQNNSDYLGRNNVFGTQPIPQCISPDMLRNGIHDGLLDPAPLASMHVQTLGFQLAESYGMADATPQNNDVLTSLQYQNIGQDSCGIGNAVVGNDETSTWISNSLDQPNVPDTTVPVSLTHETPPSLSDGRAAHGALMDVLQVLHLPMPADSSTSVTDYVKNLSQETRAALTAALDASKLEDEDRSTIDADATVKGQTSCHICDKSFKRPCELTYVIF